MDIINIIVMLYGIFSYHIVFTIMYFLVTNMSDEQLGWFKKILLMYPIMVTIIYLSHVFELKGLWLYEQLFYSLSMLLIYAMGDNDLYLLLGISSLMFISEFYEIPIYVLRYTRMGWFRLNDVSSVIAVGVIISKLLSGYYVIMIMDLLRFKHRKFISVIFGCVCIYLFSSYACVNYLYVVSRNSYFHSGIALKCICYISMLIFIYLRGLDRYSEM